MLCNPKRVKCQTRLRPYGVHSIGGSLLDFYEGFLDLGGNWAYSWVDTKALPRPHAPATGKGSRSGW